jgi:hypothetical protein
MVLHSSLAGAKVGGDILAGMAGDDYFHDLARSQSGIAAALQSILSPNR